MPAFDLNYRILMAQSLLESEDAGWRERNCLRHLLDKDIPDLLAENERLKEMLDAASEEMLVGVGEAPEKEGEDG
jgi:hypothetical protein